MELTMSKNNHQGSILNKTPIINVKRSESFLQATDSEPTEQTSLVCNTDVVGKHLIVDFWGAKSLQDIDLIESALKDAASTAGAILLHIHLHQFSSGGGITGVALLAESHISIHTWPERDYAAFDVFMCGNAQPEKAVEHLKQVFDPKKVLIKEILRG